MPQDLSNSFKLQLTQLEQDAIIELWEIDLTDRTTADGTRTGKLYRLHSGLNVVKSNVIWKGNEYVPFPLAGSGFEMTVQGTSPRPTLSLSNVMGFVTGIIVDFDQCLGATVTRRQVYAQALDAVNFANGTNRYADPTREIVTKFVIEQLSSLNSETATFTLALPTETDNMLLPARAMNANTCNWVYRSAECGYTGGAVADEKDQPTADIKKDKCSKCLQGCKLRNNTLNFGAFISIDKLG